jgi:uncharacterized membrane-anchored protein YitT (DUF2179 family)
MNIYISKSDKGGFMYKKFSAVLSYLFIILGGLMASFSVACILLPNDAIDYGTAGIAIIISKLTGFNLSLCVISIFVPFLVAGYFFLGKKFTLKAFLGAFFYTAGLEFFEKIPFELNTEHFLAVAFGGALLGAGLALILRNGGCIDGSEIFANILLKKVFDKTGKNFSMSYILISFNAVVYIIAFAVIDRDAALLSLLVYVIASMITDHFAERFEEIKQVTIITQSPEKIVKEIKKS